jgi:hypothetical protein
VTRNEQREQELEVDKRLKREILVDVFGTPRGIHALNIILQDLRFFHWTDTEGERALNEYAKFLVRERLGVVDTSLIAQAIMTEASQSRGRK